jgi:hypothetical protein
VHEAFSIGFRYNGLDRPSTIGPHARRRACRADSGDPERRRFRTTSIASPQWRERRVRGVRETAEDLIRNVRSLGYDLDDLIERKLLVIEYVRVTASSIDEIVSRASRK